MKNLYFTPITILSAAVMAWGNPVPNAAPDGAVVKYVPRTKFCEGNFLQFIQVLFEEAALQQKAKLFLTASVLATARFTTILSGESWSVPRNHNHIQLITNEKPNTDSFQERHGAWFSVVRNQRPPFPSTKQHRFTHPHCKRYTERTPR